MSCSSKGVIAVPRVTASHHARESLKIQPQLTNVIRHLADGVLARPGAAHSVGAGVARVPDVGGVGGDGGATSGGADDAADSKSSCTTSIGATSLEQCSNQSRKFTRGVYFCWTALILCDIHDQRRRELARNSGTNFRAIATPALL